MKAIVPRLLAIALAGAAVVPLAPARGCTLAEDYYRASTYEAVQKAGAIVVATARGSGGGDYLSRVHFDVDKVLKGSAPAKVRTIGDSADLLQGELIEAIAAALLEDEERELLPGALLRWAARTGRMTDAGDRGHPFLVEVVGGTKPSGKGIACPGGTVRSR